MVGMIESVSGHAPLPIFERSTSQLYRSNDGMLRVLPMQYGFSAPTFEVRAGDVPVLCTHSRELADAYVAGYDLACERASDRHAFRRELEEAAAELGIDLGPRS